MKKMIIFKKTKIKKIFVFSEQNIYPSLIIPFMFKNNIIPLSELVYKRRNQ